MVLDLATHEVVAERRAPTPRGGQAVVDALAAVVRHLAEVVAPRPVVAVGVGVAGLVDRAGCLRYGPNLPGIVDLDVRGDLEAALAPDLPVAVTVDNDATTATWGEVALGAARGATDAVFVALGTGIGGGVVIGGRVRRGAHGFAGELGHVVVDPDGPPCPCGRRGCWERFASGSGLARLARDAATAGRADAVIALAGGDPDAVRGEHVTLAARAGDAEALAIIRDLAWWVALGVAGVVDVLDPEVVVIGGGLVVDAELLLDAVRADVAEMIVGGHRRVPPRIVAAELGDRAGAIGAALLAAEPA